VDQHAMEFPAQLWTGMPDHHETERAAALDKAEG
jgi:hypothetical protein